MKENEKSRLELPKKSSGRPIINVSGPAAKLYSYEEQLNMIQAGKKYTKSS